MSFACSSLLAADKDKCTVELNCWKQNHFQIENDSLPGLTRSGTDRFYTNGLRFSRSANFGAQKLPTWLLNLARISDPKLQDSARRLTGWSVGHQFYTPQEITQVALIPTDRPYAGFLHGSVFEGIGTANSERKMELQFGFVGPAAGAGTVQTRWHARSFIDAPKPLGWHNQLPNEPVVNLSVTQRWRLLNGRRRFSSFDFVPKVAGTVGNGFTGLRVGGTIRVGRNISGFPYTPIAPVDIDDESNDQSDEYRDFEPMQPNYEWYLFFGTESRFVARNIFLDGTSLSSSHSVDKESFVTESRAGFRVRYRKLSFDVVWISQGPELKTQRSSGIDHHDYASIGITYRSE